MCTYASEGTSASGFKIRSAPVDFHSPCDKLEPAAKRHGCINFVRCTKSSIVVLDFFCHTVVSKFQRIVFDHNV